MSLPAILVVLLVLAVLFGGIGHYFSHLSVGEIALGIVLLWLLFGGGHYGYGWYRRRGGE